MITDREKTVKEITAGLKARHIYGIIIGSTILGMASCTAGISAANIILQTNFILGIIFAVFSLLAIIWIRLIISIFLKKKAEKITDQMIQFEKATQEKAINLFQKNCYYISTASIHGGGAIAAYPSEKKFAFITGELYKNNFKKIVLDTTDIRRVQAIQPGVTTFEYVSGGDSLARLHAAEKNVQEAMRQTAETGLHVETSNLEHREMFFNMDFDDAKAWILIFEKMRDGNLEFPEKPTAYPFIKE